MAEADFQGRLLPGERILWTGVPGTGLLLSGRDVFTMLFSVVWLGFSMFSIFGHVQGAIGPQQYVIATLFGAVGLYIGFGRLLTDMWLRRRLSYALTNQRVLILQTGEAARFTALPVDRLPALSLTEKGDGRGTIRFSEADNPWARTGWATSSSIPQFLMIPDARSVFDRIQKAGRA
jgi:hypothetical protein